MSIGDGEPSVAVTRDGVTESLHRAHVALVSGSRAVSIMGSSETVTYPRSSLKPFQALATAELLAKAGLRMTTEQTALACASHTGSDTHQIEAASMLAEADVDESALRCPPAWPADDRVRQTLAAKTSLSHNCSGKHASMIWGSVAAGLDPDQYLAAHGEFQQHVARRVADVLGEALQGPGVDGCGAPAWRCSLAALARGFATLSAGADRETAEVRDAMTTRPELVGGGDLPDTAMMVADERVVAKRGADGVMACGFRVSGASSIGVAVKIEDGSDRAAGPLAAAVLHALGAVVPTDVLRVPVLGGGVPHGQIAAVSDVAERVHAAA
ncbi:asparaginase [Euzebya tangerina]|uniref:asparaginase n=1 Tax=Euzebya tangerina TaxID=591198 RepID=UPI0013C2CB04|nr:asparaginase [Euzebya tangerina]